jgi:hypothetical protein
MATKNSPALFTPHNWLTFLPKQQCKTVIPTYQSEPNTRSFSCSTNICFALQRFKFFFFTTRSFQVSEFPSASCINSFFARNAAQRGSKFVNTKAGRLYLVLFSFLFTSSALLMPEQPRIGAHLL